MKRLFVIALCLMFSQAIWAQKFTVPAIPGEIEETEYAKYVQDFNRCMDWLEKEVRAAYTNYEEGMAAAAAKGKPVMLDFTGFGCVNCRKMEIAVWTDPTVADKASFIYK